MSVVSPENTTLKLRHIFVTGKVQGVFFRKYTQKTAREYGVTGWVRNTTDGRVEMVAEGTIEQIGFLERWCHSGSPRSSVTAVVADDIPQEEDRHVRRFTSFEIVS
ncbi:acylphosphatase [Angomonas deanei]|uniref:Acylphosphatase n=1 Tax=Angomonas deanei TaxID=59799 RepID=A0A7G2CD90_9TRYP|nr:acylphosphatase [Angomonas deanei]CAD2217395.1 Acylphosphatase, putative [Angomonas deanei]|eukprot:EPY22169.1 acylphosphatase [Angomonas deanei]